MPLRTVTATRYVTPLREGGSLPGLVEADDDGLYVLKFRGAGQGAKVAVVVAWVEIAAFAFFHLIPVAVGPSKPYWGDATGDPLQWVGLLSILAVSAAIVHVARRTSKGSVTLAGASLS
jgi:hypothetical protein